MSPSNEKYLSESYMELDGEENDTYAEKNFRKAAVKSIGGCSQPEFLVIEGFYENGQKMFENQVQASTGRLVKTC
jgi:hypothetical protein